MVMPKAGVDAYAMMRTHFQHGMAEDTALDFLRPIIDAVCHLHRSGFAHQDVKSENILVQYREGGVIDHVCLIGTARTAPFLQHYPRFDVIPHCDSTNAADFDTCCDVAYAQPQDAPGSLGFMAPEAMIKFVPNPEKLDVWSLGCVLLELVRGGDHPLG